MGDDQVFSVAAELGLDPEVVAELLAALQPGAPGERASSGPAHLRTVSMLGRGGTAEVWRAHDARLDRTVAMKVLRPELAGRTDAHERFSLEARVTARLAHPGIIGVHEIGVLADGRPYFTMDEVHGRTLDEVAADEQPGDRAGLRRLIEVFRRAVEAVAYAHTEGVVHRDLKPANIMVGAFGTVFVLDWGLVRSEPAAGDAPQMGLTAQGAVPGTPGYLAPEQALGAPLGPATDTWALGLVLWELLHGRRAIDTADPVLAIALAAAGRVPACTDGPEALRAIVDRALRPDPTERYRAAGPLAADLGAWLDGEARRVRAQALVEGAAHHRDTEIALRAEAAEAAAGAAALLDGVAPYDPPEAKAEGWALQDSASALLRRADAAGLRQLQALHGALTYDAEHTGALEALCAHWHGEHAAAEARRDVDRALEAHAQLAYYDRGRYDAYLEGHGRLEVRTEPAGAEVVLFRLVEERRCLVQAEPRALGPTPVGVEGLEMGSYVVRVAGYDAPLPVWIRRGTQARLPVLERVRPSDADVCLVPGGPFWSGTPGTGFQSRPWREEWVDTFLIGRHEVTQAEYLAFINALVSSGREEEALRHAPHERGARPDQPGPLCYARGDDGLFALAPDADGDLWDPRWPVFLVDVSGAEAYCAWRAAETGLPWRLPTELEWEKAARGVDGRSYPWGDHFDASFACVRTSHAGRPVPAVVDAYAADCSVYGVRGMAGNMRDWCSDPFRPGGDGPAAPGDQRVLKGGCWYFPESGAHLAARYALDGHNRADTISFRVARSLVQGDLL